MLQFTDRPIEIIPPNPRRYFMSEVMDLWRNNWDPTPQARAFPGGFYLLAQTEFERQLE